jgi:hypothetical protein
MIHPLEITKTALRTTSATSCRLTILQRIHGSWRVKRAAFSCAAMEHDFTNDDAKEQARRRAVA